MRFVSSFATALVGLLANRAAAKPSWLVPFSLCSTAKTRDMDLAPPEDFTFGRYRLGGARMRAQTRLLGAGAALGFGLCARP